MPLLVVLAAFAMLGCHLDSTDPFSMPTLDQALHEASVSAVVGSSKVIGVDSFVPPAASSCGYDAGTQWFVCAPVTASDGATYTRSYALLDPSGTKQSEFGPTIAAVRTRVAMHRPAVLGTTSDASEDMTLSGLLTGVHVLDGTFAGGVTSITVNTPPVTIQTHRDGQVTHLVLPSTPGTYPNGTITFDASSATNGIWGTPVHNLMEYNGTHLLKVTYGSDAYTRCVVDLASSNPSCV